MCDIEYAVKSFSALQKARLHGILAQENVRSSELAFSSTLARQIDRFLFDDKQADIGAVLHQGPVDKRPKKPGNPDAADMYICKYDSMLPYEPVLLADVDMVDFKYAMKETAMYCLRLAISRQKKAKWFMYLGLPATPRMFSHFVCTV